MRTGGAQLTWSPAALLRITTEPGGLDLPPELDLTPGAAPAPVLAWLAEVWSNDALRDAVAAASPPLHAQLAAALTGDKDSDRVRRAATAVAAYLLRWQRRQTPFGLFAGVGPARFTGTAVKARCGTAHRYVLRADAGWLGEVTARLAQCRELADRIPVVACNTAVQRGGRLVAPGAAAGSGPGGEAALEVSVRATGPVVFALAQAAGPVRLGQLREALAARFPAANPAQIDAVLGELANHQFLISALRVPMSEPDALRTVCRVLHDADAENIAEIAGLVRELTAIRDALAGGSVDAIPPGIVARMTALASGPRTPLLIDTAADCEAELPEAVAREIRDAVTMLYRLSPYPFGYPTWRDYHTAFRARYGTGALVPVLDLVSDSGLGLPAGFLGSARETIPRQLSERDEKLMALVQEATIAGGELALTDAVIDHLCADSATGPVLPPRTEVAFEIHAATAQDLSAGRFQLELTGTPRPASSMAGRHAYLLPPEALTDLQATFELPTPDLLAAQLSFAPRQLRSENVARTTVLTPRIIPLAEHRAPDPDVIDPADLAVTADDRGFHLVQISTGLLVQPMVTHALEATVHTPPLARFLAEIATACCAVYRSFSFGAASTLPYLPRVRYRRTILSPARWRLDAEQLPGRKTDAASFERALGDWRTRWRVPDHVALIDHDRRQPVDLRHPTHRHLLRTRLRRAGYLELQESAPPDRRGWIGRAHEILLPLTRTTLPDRPTAVTAPARVLISAADLRLPASAPVLAARLYAHPERFDEILTDHLPALLSTFGDGAECWFHRHRNLRDHQSDQYLALFLAVTDADGSANTAGVVADWVADLHRGRLAAQLTFASWLPPTGRFGQGPALDAVLRVFAADSTAALAQIRAARGGPPSQALAAASFLNLATALAGDAAAGREWLLAMVPQSRGRLDPELRRQTVALAEDLGPLAQTSAGHAVMTAWRHRATALADYAAAAHAQRTQASVLGPLLHLHHLRVVGAGTEAERITGRLARALALRPPRHREETIR
ncbi:lantibiotic dehydratase [Frankia sp. B2]|uniref:lantibiotic dehydratase n=1 Tax=Frankia sp. B2 TaxID=2541730 RepID=UPI00106CB9FE|nr:lantibiotic dehydratase [Frankia sp. B2]TFE24661.1 lantibiotic dehydratase [Frankia sp. B2]